MMEDKPKKKSEPKTKGDKPVKPPNEYKFRFQTPEGEVRVEADATYGEMEQKEGKVVVPMTLKIRKALLYPKGEKEIVDLQLRKAGRSPDKE